MLSQGLMMGMGLRAPESPQSGREWERAWWAMIQARVQLFLTYISSSHEYWSCQAADVDRTRERIWKCIWIISFSLLHRRRIGQGHGHHSQPECSVATTKGASPCLEEAVMAHGWSSLVEGLLKFHQMILVKNTLTITYRDYFRPYDMIFWPLVADSTVIIRHVCSITLWW